MVYREMICIKEWVCRLVQTMLMSEIVVSSPILIVVRPAKSTIEVNLRVD